MEKQIIHNPWNLVLGGKFRDRVYPINDTCPFVVGQRFSMQTSRGNGVEDVMYHVLRIDTATRCIEIEELN